MKWRWGYLLVKQLSFPWKWKVLRGDDTADICEHDDDSEEE